MGMLEIYRALKARIESHGHTVFTGVDIVDPERDQIKGPIVLLHMGSGGSTVSSVEPVERSDLDIVVRYIDEVCDAYFDNPLLKMLEVEADLEPQIFKKEPCSGVDTLDGTCISFVKTTTFCAMPDGWSRHYVIEFSANADYISEV